jgi:hypothetical protein
MDVGNRPTLPERRSCGAYRLPGATIPGGSGTSPFRFSPILQFSAFTHPPLNSIFLRRIRRHAFCIFRLAMVALAISSERAYAGFDETYPLPGLTTSLRVRTERVWLSDLTTILTPQHGEFTLERPAFNPGAYVRFSPHDRFERRWPLSKVVDWSLELGARNPNRLTPGAYVGALGRDSAEKPYINSSQDLSGSEPWSGGFFIHEIEYHDFGYPTKLWATFRMFISDYQEIAGEIRFNTEPGPLKSSGPNQPPAVDAGPSITIDDEERLRGSVADDGVALGRILKTRWSVVSGPGIVTFVDIASPGTMATFSAAGVYVLRLTAEDGEYTASSDVTLTVSGSESAPAAPVGPYSGVVMSQGSGSSVRGWMTLQFDESGAFSGNVRVGTTRYPFSGALSDAGTWNDSISLGATGTGEMTLAPNARAQIVGTLSVGGNVSKILLDSEMSNFPFPGPSGRYAVALVPDANGMASSAKGNGFGIVNLASRRNVRCVLTLPDGTVATYGGAINDRHVMPMDVNLPRAKGLLSGRICFDEYDEDIDFVTGATCGGNIVWTAVQQADGSSEPTVSSLEYGLIGAKIRRSKYGAVKNPGVRWNRIIEVNNPSLANPLLAPILAPGFQLLKPALGVRSLTLNGSNGLFRGKYVDPVTKTAGTFKGIVLRNSCIGYGFSRDKSGSLGSVETQAFP